MLTYEVSNKFLYNNHIVLSKRVKQTRSNDVCLEIHLYQIQARGVDEAHLEYGNAIKMMARILKKLLFSGFPVSICEWNGDESECETVIPVKSTFLEDEKRIIEETFQDILREADNTNEKSELVINEFEFKGHVMDKKDNRDLINLIYLLPNHCLGKSHTSQATFSACLMKDIRVNGGKLQLIMEGLNQYSSSMEELYAHIRTLAYLYQFEYQIEEKEDE